MLLTKVKVHQKKISCCGWLWWGRQGGEMIWCQLCVDVSITDDRLCVCVLPVNHHHPLKETQVMLASLVLLVEGAFGIVMMVTASTLPSLALLQTE